MLTLTYTFYILTQAFDLDEDKFASLPMLKTSSFSYILKLAYDCHSQIEGLENLMNSICQFLSACLLNYSWAMETILIEDCCVSVSMLISTYHRLDLEPSQLLRILALLLG